MGSQTVVAIRPGNNALAVEVTWGNESVVVVLGTSTFVACLIDKTILGRSQRCIEQ